MTTKTIVCPHCNKDDRISKLSAVYSGGFSTAQNNSPLVAYGVEQRTITTITPLAQELAPPTRLVYMGIFAQSERSGCGDVLSQGVGIIFLQIWWVIVAVIVGVFAGNLVPTTNSLGNERN